MCSLQAESYEHVPPKSLFPEQKDTNGVDYRKDLITVPSCKEHNMEKSADDEFLMVCLSGLVGNNAVAYAHTHTKISRAAKRRGGNFYKPILVNPSLAYLTLENKFKIQFLIGDADVERLRRCFNSIAYGIYYHHFDKRFEGECPIFIGFVIYEDGNLEKLKEYIEEKFRADHESVPRIGRNPAIFYYQMCPPDDKRLILLKMVFYERSEVFVTFRHKDAPFDLVLALRDVTSKMVFTFPDREPIELNYRN